MGRVNFLKILPMAFVMIAGPQILSAIFLATSENWRRNSVAYVGGAAVSVTGVVTIAYVLAGGSSSGGSSDDKLDVLFLILLVLAAVWVFARRKTSQPPKWMGRLQTARPRLAFRLGFLLLGVFPADVFTSVAVGSFLSNHGDPWWHLVPFLVLTLLLLAAPAILVLALGRRADAFLPRVRDWMHDNSWIVSEAVIVLFIAIESNTLFG